MKKSTVVLFVVLLMFVAGAYLETARSTTSTLRSAVDDGSGLTDLSWDARQSDTERISRKQNTLVFHFLGSADNITCIDVEIWAYVRSGSAQLQWIGGVVAGAAVDDNSLYIADTITTTTDETAQGVTLLDIGSSDRHATLRFDAAELEYWSVYFPTVSAGTWTCQITGY